METKYVGIRLPSGNVILRLQQLSVNKTLDMMSPSQGIYDQVGGIKDWKALYDYAVTNETRFVWEETESGPVLLDYESKIGIKGWRVLGDLLWVFSLTGDLTNISDSVVLGDLDSIRKTLNEPSGSNQKTKE